MPFYQGTTRLNMIALLSATPPIDADEQKEPNNVDKMPVPCSRLKSKVMLRVEVPCPSPKPTDNQKAGSN